MPCIRYVAREYFDRMRTGEHVGELVTTGGLDRGGGVHPMIIEQRMNTALVDVSCAMDREAGQYRHCCCQGKAQSRHHGAHKVHARGVQQRRGGRGSAR